MQDDTLVAFGGAIKALGNGKWRGHLVQYGDPASADFVADFFTKHTDYDWPEDAETIDGTIYYQHGMDAVLKQRKLGKATLGRDEFGIWAEGQLALRDQYEKFIYSEMEAGRMGLSSGTLPNLVARKSAPNGTREITHWPIGKDVSITPNPCDPRNVIVALKSLDLSLDLEAGAQAGNSAAATVESVITESPLEDSTVENTTETTTTPTAPVAVDVAAIAKEAAEAAIKAFQEAQPAIKTAGVVMSAPDAATAESKEETAVKSWGSFIRTGDRSGVKAAMQVGTASEGGYLVPQTYSNELITALTEQSILRIAGARVITISGTKGFKVPSRTDSGAAVLTAEEAAFDEKEPTVGELDFVPYKYTKLVKVSDELLEDSRIDITSQVLLPDTAQAFAAAENTAFTTGTGSSQPQGIVTGSALGKTAASATAITMDEIIDLVGSVSYVYRPRAKFMMNDATITYVRKLKDSDGQYLWQPSNQAGQPDRLMGYPVIPNNSVATIAASAKSILFGDFSYYWITDLGVTSMRRLDELYAANGQVGFRWYKRFDGKVTLSAAIKHLIQAAS